MGAILSTRNLAGVAGARDIIREVFSPLALQTRRERQPLNQQWLRYDNLLKSRHDSDAYHGRNRAYLSVGRRVIDNWVTKLKNDLFPDSGKWFAVHAETLDSDDGVPILEALFRRYLLDYMAIRRKASPILRDLVTFGTKPLDIGWRYAHRQVPTIARVWQESGENPAKAAVRLKEIVDYLGPTLRPIDIFRWYVYPTTVNDVSDLTLCWEDLLLDWPTIERQADTWINPDDHRLGHHFENLAAAKELLDARDGRAKDSQAKFDAERRRLAGRGLQSPADRKDDPNQLLTVMKGFWRTERFQDLEDEEEDPRGPAPWYQLVIAGDDEPLQIRRVVFWDGQPSTLCTKFVEVWGEFYGYGLPSSFDSLHYMMNDILNQGGDALTFALNPIVGIDPGAVADMTTLRMKPGAKWLVRRPRENLTFTEPPKEAAQAAMAAVEQMIALVNDVANVAPFGGAGLSGPRQRGRALNTAGGMQIVANEALVQVHDVVQTQEDLWLNPMLRAMYSRTEQCLDVPLLLNIEGAGGAAMLQKQVSREDVLGVYTFRWQASVSSFNLQVRGQQMVNFLQIVSRIPPQMLQMENARLSLTYLLKTLWTDGFQLPEAERLIREIQPVRSLDPALENQLILSGRVDDVAVSPADDDQKHAQIHDQLLGPGILDPVTAERTIAHVKAHVAAMLTKAMMQAQGGGGGGGQPGLPGTPQNGAPGGPGNASGSGALAGPTAPGRLAQTNDAGDLARQGDRAPAGGLQ